MKITVYLPDDLGARVQAADMNVSGVCQSALQTELTRQEDAAELRARKGMDRVVVDASATHSGKVSFVGSHIATHDSLGLGNSPMDAYLTEGGRIAVYDYDGEALHVFDSFDDLAGDYVWRESHPDFLAMISGQLGHDFVAELDI